MDDLWASLFTGHTDALGQTIVCTMPVLQRENEFGERLQVSRPTTLHLKVYSLEWCPTVFAPSVGSQTAGFLPSRCTVHAHSHV